MYVPSAISVAQLPSRPVIATYRARAISGEHHHAARDRTTGAIDHAARRSAVRSLIARGVNASARLVSARLGLLRLSPPNRTTASPTSKSTMNPIPNGVSCGVGLQRMRHGEPCAGRARDLAALLVSPGRPHLPLSGTCGILAERGDHRTCRSAERLILPARGQTDGAPRSAASTWRASSRPSAIAHTISDAPRWASPAQYTPGTLRRVARVDRDVAARDRARRRAARRAGRCSGRRSRARGSACRPAIRDLGAGSSTRTPIERGQLAVVALEPRRAERERALAAFLLRARRAEHERPRRPRVGRGALGGRRGHQLDLRDVRGALAMRGAEAVGAGVAAAEDDDALAADVVLRCGAARRRRPGSARSGSPSRARRRRARGPGTSRSRGRIGADRDHDRVVLGAQLRPRRARADRARRSGARRPRPRAARAGDRSRTSPS